MKSKLMIFSVSVILTVGLISCGKSPKEKRLSEVEKIPVKIAPVQFIQTAGQVSATGLITTEHAANYAFKIGGIIDRIVVEEGESFRKGQLLATLKSTEIDTQLSQAELALEKALRDYGRVNNLYKDSVATLEQLQNAGTGLDMARQTVELVNFNKKYASILATADGFVTKKLAAAGEVVAPGMPVLAINETLGDNNWVLKTGMSDSEWAAVSLGDKATISIDAFPGRNFEGVVSRLSLAADPMSGSFGVEVKINMKETKSRPAVGMFGKAVIKTSGNSILAIVPYDAVIEADGNNGFVFIPDDNNGVKRVSVIIESFNDQNVIIRSGLEKVKQVVVSNNAFLNDHSVIVIVK